MRAGHSCLQSTHEGGALQQSRLTGGGDRRVQACHEGWGQGSQPQERGFRSVAMGKDHRSWPWLCLSTHTISYHTISLSSLLGLCGLL